MQGIVGDSIKSRLTQYPEFRSFAEGKSSIEEYSAWIVHRSHALLRQTELTENELHLSSRLVFDWQPFVEDCCRRLQHAGFIRAFTFNPRAAVSLQRRIQETYRHGSYKTYIFDEEAILLSTIASALPPKRVIAAGSFYGYWAIWAALAAPPESRFDLLDIDQQALDWTTMNWNALHPQAAWRSILTDAIPWLRSTTEAGDFLLLDAEGPRGHGDPRLRGKAIYGPIVESFLAGLGAHHDALIVAHNILLEHRTQSEYFDRLIQRNQQELAEFHGRLADAGFHSVLLPSTEGVGVYWRPSGQKGQADVHAHGIHSSR